MVVLALVLFPGLLLPAAPKERLLRTEANVAAELTLTASRLYADPFNEVTLDVTWKEVMRFIRATDPFHRPLTIHPTGIGRLSARNATDDAALLDFDMLQTPHGTREAVPVTVKTVRESYADAPVMSVINGEASAPPPTTREHAPS